VGKRRCDPHFVAYKAKLATLGAIGINLNAQTMKEFVSKYEFEEMIDEM